MKFLPLVSHAEYVAGYSIRLRFNDGLEKTVDCRRWLVGPVFRPLKDKALFKRFFVEGGTIAWPNGADIAPETLYRAPGPASASCPIR